MHQTTIIMNEQLQTQAKRHAKSLFMPAPSGSLQRTCACDQHTGAGDECAACKQKRAATLQRAAISAPPIAQPLDAATRAFMEPRFGHDFSPIPVYTHAGRALQTKLAINTPGDEYEQEADHIADQVLAEPAHPDVSSAPPHIQRFVGPATGAVDTAPASVDRVLSSAGRPLDPALQQDMGQRFGHDFSRVRVHSGTAAEQSARDVSAHAYTVGHNIVFGAGQFAPDTQQGRRLLAHELTHVVQQSGTDGSRIDQRSETGSLTPMKPANQAVQRWSWAGIKENFYDTMIAGIHKARDGMRNGLKRLAAEHLPASLFPIADTIIEIAVTVVEILVALIMAVLGIVVGFGEGIIGMIEGLFKLAYGVITLLYDLIAGIFTNFDAAKQDLNAVWSALMNLPSALQKLVTDWLDKFSKAPSERQSLMIGELTGQVLALIATFAVAAGRAGSAAKVGATTGDAVAATGDAAAVTGATGDAAATAARARPVLTVIEDGGQSGSTAARAAAGRGAGDIVGNNALKMAPAAEPIAPPLRLVPALPAEAAPAVAKAVALAPSGTKAAGVGAGMAAATATNLAPKPAPKKPSCGSPTGLTRADPISMIWYKVREDDYYPKRLSIQSHVYGRDDPSNPRTLPHGEPLGVPNKYWPRLGKVMQLIPSERGSKAADFRAVLTGYGFDWSGLQADHVQDLDWSGPDEFENLWPLSDSANMSAGTRQNSHQRITYCETLNGPEVVDQRLSDFKLSPSHYGRYFRIERVER